MKLVPDPVISREILKLASPAVAGLSAQMILTVVDAAMVGRLDEVALAAMGVGFLAVWVVTSFFSNLGVGTQTLVSRRQGEGNHVEAGVTLNNSLAVSLLIGVVLGFLGWHFSYEIAYPFASNAQVASEAADYLKWRFIGLPFFLVMVSYRGFFFGVGNTRIFMYSAIIINVLNIILNYLLIFGHAGFPRLELTGSAVATTIATFVGTAIFFLTSFNRAFRIGYRLFHRVKIKPAIIRNIFRISLPVSFQYLFTLLGFLFFLAIIGRFGTTEQAATQVVITAILIGFLPSQGFGIAAATLVGQNLGNGNTHNAERYGIESARLGFYFMFVVGIVFLVFPDAVLYIITNNKPVIETARAPLRIVGAVQAFYAVGIILASALQGAGATIFVMFTEIFLNWGIFIPLAYVFGVVLDGGMVGAWLSLPVYLVLYASIMVWRFKRGAWKRVRV